MVEESGRSQQLVCESCGESFLYSEAERRRDERTAYPSAAQVSELSPEKPRRRRREA